METEKYDDVVKKRIKERNGNKSKLNDGVIFCGDKGAKYKIVAKNDKLAVHSVGYHGEQGRDKAQRKIDSGECAKYWADKEQARQGFIVINDE